MRERSVKAERRFRLLAIDIDGTLVNSQDEITPATRDALGSAIEAGIHVVLATGRRYGQAIHLAEALGLSVPVITASGALIKNPSDHRTLFVAEFEPRVLCRMLSTITEAGYDPIIFADTYLEGFEFYHAREDSACAYLTQYLHYNRGRGRLWPNLVSAPPAGVFTGFAIGTREQMIELEQVLHRRLPGELYTHVLRSPRYSGFLCELARRDVTKWSAIRWLASGWGIQDHEICTVGDDVNDIPMIRHAGLGIAMGNALPEVKAVADRVAPGQDEDGLVAVVEWLLED